MPEGESNERSDRERRLGEQSADTSDKAIAHGRLVLRAAASAVPDFAFLLEWFGLGARARRWIHRQKGRAIDGPAVLLLPGVYENPHFLDPFAALGLACGRPVHVVGRLGLNRSPVLTAAEVAAAYLEQSDLDDVTIIAHSKGGLVGKQLMTWEHTGSRIARMIAIATPFSGSAFAQGMPDSALRIFAPSDTTLLDLGADRRANDRIVSIFPSFDPLILEGSALPGAEANVRLPGSGHFHVLGHPELWRLLRGALRGVDVWSSVPAGDRVSGTR